jgi:hypothetical protein
MRHYQPTGTQPMQETNTERATILKIRCRTVFYRFLDGCMFGRLIGTGVTVGKITAAPLK